MEECDRNRELSCPLACRPNRRRDWNCPPRSGEIHLPAAIPSAHHLKALLLETAELQGCVTFALAVTPFNELSRFGSCEKLPSNVRESVTAKVVALQKIVMGDLLFRKHTLPLRPVFDRLCHRFSHRCILLYGTLHISQAGSLRRKSGGSKGRKRKTRGVGSVSPAAFTMPSPRRLLNPN
jgi:hypothetical protein